MTVHDVFEGAWEEAIEYGNFMYGVLPDGTVTGVILNDGDLWKTYIEGPESPRYPRWEQQYQHTPLGDALEAFHEKGPMAELSTSEVVYEGTHYEEKPMESALTGWRFEYERRHHFRKRVLRGDITLPAPAFFNRYGELFIVEGHTDEVEDLYWNFISSNYENRMSHYSTAKS